MEPPTEQELRNKIWATFLQAREFTSIELDFLRSHIQLLAHYNEPTAQVAQTRVAVELLDSIQRFDKVSSDLIETTNKLTARVLTLTIWGVVIAGFGLLMAGASLCLSFLALQRH